jgi:hypothetical protein
MEAALCLRAGPAHSYRRPQVQYVDETMAFSTFHKLRCSLLLFRSDSGPNTSIERVTEHRKIQVGALRGRRALFDRL